MADSGDMLDCLDEFPGGVMLILLHSFLFVQVGVNCITIHTEQAVPGKGLFGCP